MYEVGPDILRLSKALGEETRFAIFRQIAAAERPQTVRDLVRTFGMHHSAIRIHLAKLEDAGLIVSEKQHVRGAVGRPQLAFLPNPAGNDVSLPPRNYKLLARLALDFAASGQSDEATAEDFGLEWGRSYVRENGHRPQARLSLDQAVISLAEILRGMGGNPRLVDAQDGGPALIERNCLFGDLSQRYEPLVCSLHQSAIRGMLEELSAEPFEWEPQTTLAAGDDRCYVGIRPLDGGRG